MTLKEEPHAAPARGTHLFLLDGAGVLFSTKRQELRALNGSAAFIWCCLEEGMARVEIGVALVESFGLDQAEAEGFVALSLTEWRKLGLLAGAEDLAAEARSRPAAVERDAPARPDADFHAHRRYRLLDTILRLRFTDQAQLDRVHPVLAHLTIPNEPGADLTLDLALDAGGHWVECGGERLGPVTLEGLAPLVKTQVWLGAINRSSYLLYLHAGVIGVGEDCLLLPAAPGSGKTTLTAALTHSGRDYLSDEAALLESGSLEVRPLPLGLGIKPGAWPLLEPLFPALGALPTHRREDGMLVRYLPPPGPVPPPERRWTARWIVFPRYEAGAATELRPLPRVDALHRLMAECLAIPRPLERQDIADLVAWIGGIDCFELPNGGLAEAVGLINERLLSVS